MSAPTVDSVVRARAARAAGTSMSGQQSSSARAAAAVDKAYARRAGRRERTEGAASPESVGRSQFVLLIMILLGVGLVASLWLSTTAAADSYRLDAARQSTRALSERIETVHSQIAAMRSAPALARAARSLGMVQQTEVARLVVAPDGHVTVFGTPKAAPEPVAPAPVAVPAVPPASQPAAQPVPTVQPGQAVRQPGQAVGQPGQAVRQPGQAVGQPGQAVGQPGQAVGQAVRQPGQAVGQPGQVVGQPVQPGHGATPVGQPSEVLRAGEARPEPAP